MRGKLSRKFTAGLLSAAMLASSAASVMSPISVSAVQLLGQTDFEDGVISLWESVEGGTAKQNVSVKDGKLVVEVVNNTGGDGRWDLQIRHRGLRINAGHTYELTCEITADKDGYIYSTITNYNGYDDVWHDLSGEEWVPLKVEAGETYKIKTQFKSGITLEKAEWSFQYADNLGNGVTADAGMPNGSTIIFDNLSLDCITNDGNCKDCVPYTPDEEVPGPGNDVPVVPDETGHLHLLKTDFEDGELGKWSGVAMNDGEEAQKVTVEDGKLKVEVFENVIDEGRWGLQLRHNGLDIQSGYTYRVSGEIMCDNDGYIYSRVGDKNGATDLWNKLSGEPYKALKLEAGKVYKFSDTFTVEEGMEDAVFAFEYADNQGYVGNEDTGIPVGAILYLDNLSITRLVEGCDCEICVPSDPGSDVPDVPEVPDVPDVPEVPDVPDVPEVPDVTDDELLVQTDFEDGELDDWTGVPTTYEKEAQKVTVEDGKLKIEVFENVIDEGRWGLQLRHDGLDIQSGYTYKVSGEIMCDNDGYIYGRIGDKNGATDLWNKLSGESFKSLKLEAGKVYEFSDTFTAEASIDDAVFTFEYADNQGYAGNDDTGIPAGAILYIDNLSLTCLTEGSYDNNSKAQLLSQTDFEDGKLGKWSGVSATYEKEVQKLTVEDGKLKVEVFENVIDEGRWGLQLRRGGLYIKAGHTYKVSGEIMCDKDGYIYARVGDKNGSLDLWNKLSGESFKALKLEAGKVYEFSDTFTAEASIDDAVFAFEYADNQGYVGNEDTGIPAGAILYLDNLSLVDITDSIPTPPVTDEGNYVWGDANCDGSVTMADAAAVFQMLGNSDKYALSEQGAKNADVIDNGKGITAADAIAVQAVSAKLLDSAKFPMTQAEYDKAMK